ncbi:uncharacterized protein LOC135156777 [Lytechinus pictus]|uniref:uncharacterized protein LOC135156777 n=1 Tax=Lytechinus pictus TaxID=7653 RepID=UPI0030BA0737
MRKLIEVARSEDAIVAGLANALNLENKAIEIGENANLPVPIGTKRAHEKWRKRHKDNWKSQPSQGRGVMCYRFREGNRWLRNKSLMTENEYLWALKVRANVVPTRVTMARGTIGMNTNCRKCKEYPETTGHISGHCRAMKDLRLIRHDRVCISLTKAAEAAGYRIMEEPMCKFGLEKLKPDFILCSGEGTPCYVLDPTIVWDDSPNRLRKAWEGKVKKHTPLKPLLKQKYNPSTVQVYGFVCGAWGTWCPKNDEVVKILGLSKGRVRDILQKVLCDTIRIKAFMNH